MSDQDLATIVQEAERLKSEVKPDGHPEILGRTPEHLAFHDFVRANRDVLRQHPDWEGQVQYDEWIEGVEKQFPAPMQRRFQRQRNRDEGMGL